VKFSVVDEIPHLPFNSPLPHPPPHQKPLKTPCKNQKSRTPLARPTPASTPAPAPRIKYRAGSWSTGRAYLLLLPFLAEYQNPVFSTIILDAD